MKPIMKRPFFGSAILAALAGLLSDKSNRDFNAPVELLPNHNLMLQPTVGRSAPISYGPPPPSFKARPSQRQRRKAMRQARANGF